VTRAWPALLCLALACSSFANNQDGVASLEVRLPANFYLELGETVQLHAVARDAAGDSVGASLVWLTPDTTVTVDADGLVTPLLGSGTGRVQVGVFGKDTLLTPSDSLKFTLTARADSLRLVGPDSIEVATDTATSVALEVALVDTAAATGVAGRPIAFQIVDPVQSTTPTVVLRTAKTRDSVLTAGTGAPTTPMTVKAATGQTPPDRVVVEVTAYRASGQPIPGSGVQFVIRFLHQP
jgi:hypothetical protein